MSPFQKKLVAVVDEHCLEIAARGPAHVASGALEASVFMAFLAGQLLAASGASGAVLDGMIMETEVIVRQGAETVSKHIDMRTAR